MREEERKLIHQAHILTRNLSFPLCLILCGCVAAGLSEHADDKQPDTILIGGGYEWYAFPETENLSITRFSSLSRFSNSGEDYVDLHADGDLYLRGRLICATQINFKPASIYVFERGKRLSNSGIIKLENENNFAYFDYTDGICGDVMFE